MSGRSVPQRPAARRTGKYFGFTDEVSLNFLIVDGSGRALQTSAEVLADGGTPVGHRTGRRPPRCSWPPAEGDMELLLVLALVAVVLDALRIVWRGPVPEL